MGERGVYCYECKSNPCICTQAHVAITIGLVVVCLAGYGLYKLIF